MIITPVALNVREDKLRKQACFSQLSDEEIKTLAKLLVEKHFSAGDTIVNEGDHVDSFYLLVYGTAEVRKTSYENEKSQSKIVALINANTNDAIGLNETGFYSLTGLRTATVVAKTEVLVLTLTVPLFHGFSLAYPHVNEVMRQQSTQLIFRK